MQLQVSIPTQVLNPAFDRRKRQQARLKKQPYTEPKFITVPTGTVLDIDCAESLAHLVHCGQGTPFDEEAKAAVPEFNATSQEFLEARRDQLLCGHMTGDTRYDSSEGDPQAVSRMAERLKKHKVKPESQQPVHIMQAHLKLIEKLRGNANATVRPTIPAAAQSATLQAGQDSGSGDSDSKSDGQ